MGKIKDLSGNRYGKLRVIKWIGVNNHKKSIFLCVCDCGNEAEVIGGHLLSGNTLSCGCLNMEILLSKKEYKRKYNEFDLSGDFGVGYTTKGEVFYFDLEDYDKIKNYCWRIHHGYVETSIRENRKSTTYYMHRIVMPEFDITQYEIDHQDGVKNNNRKYNLRIVTHTENMQNRSVQKNSISGILGVSERDNGTWRAFIKRNFKRYSKTFKTLEEAIFQRKLWEETL